MNGASELDELFPPLRDGVAGFTVDFRALRREGHLRLAVPKSSRAAALTLALYPAQRPAARAFLGVLRGLAACHLPLPLPAVTCRISPADPFTEFLRTLAPSLGGAGGEIGIFAGNPAAIGRRWMILLFENDAPVAVVKAGVSPEARALIRKEAEFLQDARPRGAVLPRAVSETERVSAFALDYLPGQPPLLDDTSALGDVLRPWVREAEVVALGEIPAWSRLRAAGGQDPALDVLPVSPAIFHGDFAPWNIRVEAGVWRVLDWDRGEKLGVPSWDWLHYRIQSAILVEGRPPAEIARDLEVLFATEAFRAYAHAARINGHEKALALAYVRYCLRVQKQTEGAEALATLDSYLTPRWA